MTRRFLILVAVAVLAAAAADAKKQKYDPFKVPREQLVGQVKTIALEELSGLSKDYPRSDSVKANFESLLSSELQQAGFNVIPASIYRQIHQEGLDSLGGVFDPKTGAADTVKLRQVRLWTLAQLKARNQADALLHPRFVNMIAAFSSGTAHWDGAHQRMWKGTEGFFGVLDKRSGTIPALSLLVVLEDTAGNDLFLDSGGLSLTARVSGSHFEDLPEDSLYWNPRRNVGAVLLALGALTRPATDKEK